MISFLPLKITCTAGSLPFSLICTCSFLLLEKEPFVYSIIEKCNKMQKSFVERRGWKFAGIYIWID